MPGSFNVNLRKEKCNWMKTIFISLLIAHCSFLFAQTPGEWTWMKGDNAPFSSAHYGTQGVADMNNNPGARYMAISWVDSSGDFWMFGGYGNAGLYGVGNMNDLWRYNISTNTWTWMNGSASAYP